MYGKKGISHDRRGVSPVIATILLVAITIVLAAVMYVMTLGLVGGNTTTPLIGLTKSATDTNHVWTVNAITGGASILRTDIYVQLLNESGFVIQTQPLFNVGNQTGCNGSHGFLYAPSANSTFISVGDSFFLDKAYTQGCKISLVNPSATSLYAVMTV